jgi:hypothetical protein
MKLTILPDKETRRQTGNVGWSAPEGYVSAKIADKAMALKCIIQRDMPTDSLEMATHICNALLADADTVAALETAPLEGGCHG